MKSTFLDPHNCGLPLGFTTCPMRKECFIARGAPVIIQIDLDGEPLEFRPRRRPHIKRRGSSRGFAKYRIPKSLCKTTAFVVSEFVALRPN
jgi:hypothetical protein